MEINKIEIGCEFEDVFEHPGKTYECFDAVEDEKSSARWEYLFLTNVKDPNDVIILRQIIVDGEAAVGELFEDEEKLNACLLLLAKQARQYRRSILSEIVRRSLSM